jgi:AcrR family transcriptional regulator
VAELQRARILAALLRVVYERGAAGVTVGHVIEHAGISRRTFYEIFKSSDECLLAAFEEAVAQIAARVLPAWRGAGSWRERVRGALIELLSFAQEQPLLALVALGEPPAGDGRLPARREQARQLLIAAIDQGRERSARTAAPGPLTAECVLGGVGAILSARLAIAGAGAYERPDLLSLTGPLMSMIVLPYLGAAAARSELTRAAPRAAAPARGDELLPADPFKAAGMRLTYRTVRVLSAIGEHPGASNRQVAAAAEVSDQGQVSKLLRRLARAGMIANAGAGAHQGSPNAWTLTPSGQRVIATIGEHLQGRETVDFNDEQ